MTKINKTLRYKYINIMMVSIFFYAVTNIDNEIKFVLYIPFVLFYVLLFRDLLRQNYIIANEKIVVIHNLILSSTFNTDNIKKISISYHPLRRSYFQLNNGEKFKFDAWSLDRDELAKFKGINPNVI